ncbi:hypothetical protein [Methanobrevibacter sp.]
MMLMQWSSVVHRFDMVPYENPLPEFRYGYLRQDSMDASLKLNFAAANFGGVSDYAANI